MSSQAVQRLYKLFRQNGQGRIIERFFHKFSASPGALRDCCYALLYPAYPVSFLFGDLVAVPAGIEPFVRLGACFRESIWNTRAALPQSRKSTGQGCCKFPLSLIFARSQTGNYPFDSTEFRCHRSECDDPWIRQHGSAWKRRSLRSPSASRLGT